MPVNPSVDAVFYEQDVLVALGSHINLESPEAMANPSSPGMPKHWTVRPPEHLDPASA